MPRARIYPTNAARQAAYRARKIVRAERKAGAAKPGQALIDRVVAEDVRLRARDEA